MSSEGHGQYGLLDRLRDFGELLQDTGGERRPYLELQLGLVLNPSWTVHAGSVYKTDFADTGAQPLPRFLGLVRDIVALETLVSQRPLTRVEAIADVVAGTYYFEIDDIDSGSTTTLYLRMPDSSNPTATTVMALLLFVFGTRGEVQPWLGPDKLTNGPFESLTGWTESLSGAGFSSALDSVVFKGGLSSLKLVSTGAATGNATRRQDLATIVGKGYRLAAHYLTSDAFSANLVARLLVGDTAGTMTLYADGRSYDASGEAVLRPTAGQWRRFLFDFLAPATTTRLQLQLRAASIAGAGQLNFDNVTLRRIYRWNFVDPRLGASGIPESSVASQSTLFGGKTIALGGVTLINSDGALEKLFAQVFSVNRPAQVWVGGTLSDGQEIYRDDWRGAYPGRTRRYDVDDDNVSVDLEDARTLTKINCPPNFYSLVEFSGMEQTRVNAAKPLMFGDSADQNVRPTRLSVDGNGYGTYETIDPAYPVAENAPLATSGTLKVHPTEDLANKGLLGYSITDSVNDYTFTTQNTRWQVLRDIRNYQYDRSGNDVGSKASFDFNVGGAALVANVDLSGPAYKVAADLQAAMRTAIGGGDTTTTVVYTESTHKFTVAKSSGTLQLLPSSGVNKQKQSWKLLGFDTRLDKTGFLTYTGDLPTFTDADKDHILRFRVTGYRDTGAGLIGGTASAELETPAEVVSWLLQEVCMVPAAKVDVAGGFATARAAQIADGTKLRAYFDQGQDVSALIALMERVGLMDVVVDGEGVWRCKRYATGSAGARTFTDADYLSWKMYRDEGALAKMVRVRYSYHPALRAFERQVESVIDSAMPLKYGTEEVLSIDSYIHNADAGAGATLLAQRLARLSAAGPRIVEFTAAGKLCDLLPGDKVILTRSRALDATGALAAVTFRILSLGQNYMSGIGRCKAIEDVAFLA